MFGDGVGSPLAVYGQVVFARFPWRVPEVQTPNAFRTPFYLELVSRVAGRDHEITVVILKVKKKKKRHTLMSI